MLKVKIVQISAGIIAAGILGGGLFVWHTAKATNATTGSSSTQAAITHQIEQGLVASEQVIPSTVIPVGHLPNQSEITQNISTEGQSLAKIFMSTSADLTSYLTAYQTALANINKERNENVTFNSFTLNSITLSNNGTVATATYTTEVTTHDVLLIKGKWTGSNIKNGYYGSASLQLIKGRWLMSNLSWNYIPGQGP